MNTSELFVECLENEGVEVIFGIPGEETLDLMDALSRSRIRFITTRHEQGAAFMANVYGRLSSRPGVCLATLGPGATNLVTGIADAFLDRAPLVAITGQGPRGSAIKESHQYLDIGRLLQPITRWSAKIEQPEMVPEVVRKAFRLARLEKPSATHLELAEDVARMEVSARPMEVRRTTYTQALPEALDHALTLLRAAERPVIVAGNGIIRRHASGRQTAERLRSFAHSLNLPVVPTFMAKGVIDYRDPLAQPAAGLRAGDDAHSALGSADVVVAIGYDLVEWAPRCWNRGTGKIIIHIDSTPAEIDDHYIPAVELVGEIGQSLVALEQAIDFHRDPWMDGRHRGAALDILERHRGDRSFPMKPQRVVADLRTALGDQDVLVSDVGVHKLWLSTLFPAATPNTVIVANGLASMGIAVPGALAAKLVHPDRNVVAVTGDGGFLMNSQELETAKREHTPFVTVVWTDNRYGVIALNQERRYGRSYGTDFQNPDLVKYARSFGLPGFRVRSADDLLPTLRKALRCDLPSIVEVPIEPTYHHELGNLEARSAMLPVAAAHHRKKECVAPP